MIESSFEEVFLKNIAKANELSNFKLDNEIKDYLTNICVYNIKETTSIVSDSIIDAHIICGNLPNSKDMIEYLKMNGDYYLCMIAFMPEAFCSNGKSINYSISIGRYSYYRLHQKIKKDSLYKKIAYNYIDIISILNETFDSMKEDKNSIIIKSWPLWKETGNLIFRKRLERAGMLPNEINE